MTLAKLAAATGAEGLVGLDFAPGMLDLARRALAGSAGRSPTLILGDATALPLRDASFDCLFCSYVLNVLPAKAIAEALAESRRVLRSGGRLALVALTPGEGEDAAFTDDWQRRFARDPEGVSATRPLLAADAVRVAGFMDVERQYVGGEGRLALGGNHGALSLVSARRRRSR